MKKQLLIEARRIGDQLLTEAKTGSKGIYWETISMDLDGNTTFKTSEGIYSGVSGIALFFLELYNRTQDERYMNAAVQGMEWVEDYCQKNSTQYHALFTGRMGVSYALLRMHEVLGKSDYLEKALEIARPCTGIVNSPYQVADLINGISGTLLGLVHLHAATGEKWILEVVDKLINNLIDRAHQGPAGLYWDRSSQSIGGLCGFSHGAAGIGFVFLELGRYFQIDSFLKLAEQAFLYERHFYDKEKKNWPDLRKGVYKDEDYERYKETFLEGDMDFFSSAGDMNAWCHGAAGIGLSRLRAYRLLKKPVYKEEALAAIEKTIRTDIECDVPLPSFILCHGGGGNAELFLYAYQTLNDDRYLSQAEKIAQKGLAFYKNNKYYLPGFRGETKQEDRSLFMGNAGVGYFYLRVLAPDDVPSVLIPEVRGRYSAADSISGYSSIVISVPEVQKRIIQKNFLRTLVIAGEVMPRKLEAFFEDHVLLAGDTGSGPTEAFIAFMKTAIPSLPPRQQEILSDIFDLEVEKRRMDEAVKSHALLDIKEKILTQQAKENMPTDDDAFLRLTLRLEPDIKVGTTQWNWNLSTRDQWTANMEEEPDTWAVLLKPAADGIIETVLSPFSYVILDEFREPRQVSDVIPVTIDAFESMSPDQEEMLKGKIYQQIRQALLSGILIEGDFLYRKRK